MTLAPRFERPPRSACGFSLIELLCVVVVLVILTVMVDNRLAGSRNRTTRERCRKNLLEISIALNFYAGDNHGNFPLVKGATSPAAPLSLLIPRCTTETAMFICPGTSDPPLPEGESFARRRISYAYYMGQSTNLAPGDPLLSDWQVDTLAKFKGQLLFSPNGKRPANNHGKEGGNVLLGSGEAKSGGTNAPCDLPLPAGIILLNPLP